MPVFKHLFLSLQETEVVIIKISTLFRALLLPKLSAEASIIQPKILRIRRLRKCVP